jgi:hypothetical protein
MYGPFFKQKLNYPSVRPVLLSFIKIFRTNHQLLFNKMVFFNNFQIISH